MCCMFLIVKDCPESRSWSCQFECKYQDKASWCCIEYQLKWFHAGTFDIFHSRVLPGTLMARHYHHDNDQSYCIPQRTEKWSNDNCFEVSYSIISLPSASVSHWSLSSGFCFLDNWIDPCSHVDQDMEFWHASDCRRCFDCRLCSPSHWLSYLLGPPLTKRCFRSFVLDPPVNISSQHS